jgi:predicted nucleic acid-binding protein
VEFVDTNVLVHAHDPSAERRHASARDLLDRLWRAGSVLSIQVFQDFSVTITRRVRVPVSADIVDGIPRSFAPTDPERLHHP